MSLNNTLSPGTPKRTPLSPSKTNIPSSKPSSILHLLNAENKPPISLPSAGVASEKAAPISSDSEVKRQKLSPAPPAVDSTNGPVVVDDAEIITAPAQKTAARTVYDTLEIRRRILDFATKRTLARFLRVEQAVTASVAEVLYHTVDLQRLARMTRSDPRRAVYCDAVRVIDRNALSPLEVFPHNRKRSYDPKQPHRVIFREETVIENVAKWRKKLPNLQKVLWYEHPSNHLEDAYVIHLRGEEIHVDLQSVIQLGSTPAPASPSLDSMANIYSFPGLEIGKHTFAIHIPRCQPEHLNGWREWLWNPDLDRRVTSIHTHAELLPPLEGIISFLAERKSRRCEPMTALYLPQDYRAAGITPAQLQELATALGPGGRTLHITESLLAGFGDVSGVIAILDDALPNLRTLHLEYFPEVWDYPSTKTRLSFDQPTVPSARRLINLRLFHFWPDRNCSYDTRGEDAEHHLNVLRNIYRIGTKDCVFLDGGLKHAWQVKEFNDVIKQVKAKPSLAKTLSKVCEEKEKVSNGWNPGWRRYGGW